MRNKLRCNSKMKDYSDVIMVTNTTMLTLVLEFDDEEDVALVHIFFALARVFKAFFRARFAATK